jgi:hypothetical protein
MTTFPKNNLPTGSLNWSREVEKAVNNLETTFKSAEINNAARDTQLQNNYKRLDSTLVQLIATNAAVEQAQNDALGALTTAAAANDTAESANAAAIAALEDASAAQADAISALQGLGSLDESTSTYKINASNLTVGTLDASVVNVTNLNASNITSGTLSADRISGGTISGVGNITSMATIFAAVNLGAGGNLGLNGSIFMGGSIDCDGSITRTTLSGGGTTGASFTNSGSLVRTTSSQRYKTDIEPLEIDLTDLYSVEPKTFKRIEEVEEDPETARIYPGFIAEELAGTSLDKFVFYSQDEQGNSRPEGIHYPELTAALLLAIKDLNVRLSALEDRV